ncbi:membrane-targeted effector domain-containing toxin [uncultured Flavobacterium sp.]|uniref:membrane-targeted effector domain-containing toxin n=1 Tax=uncultured Flavobacterium sp. TaxID=165435 RepID=UPI00292EFC87|nr:membrane-targeted effector domain-containing toxin [uncultured Flavobacterium sp.]
MEHFNKINKNKQPSLTPKTVQTKAIYLQDNRPASTLQMKGKVNVNDDKGLEKEADVMGAKATQLFSSPNPSTQLRFSAPNQSAPAQLMFGRLKGMWNHFTGQGTTPVTPPTIAVTPPPITYKQTLELERKRNLKAQKRNRLEAIWKKQGIIFHVHKPNANEDPDWVENFEAIHDIVKNDEGFEFQTGKKAINIKYNFIQLLELFTHVGAHLFNMVPRELQKAQGESIMECFGTPHFMEIYQNKKQTLLADSRKIVTDMNYENFDSEFGKKQIPKKFNKKKNAEKIDLLLGKDKFEGFTLGENHDNPKSKEFLMNHMENLKKNKVTTIYLEHIRSEYQSIIDEWYASAALTPMPAKLNTFLDSNDVSNGVKGELHNLKNLVQKAYNNQIRIVGIDSLHAQYDPDETGGDELRSMTMNAFAQQTIEGDKEKRMGGKYVALVGGKHSNTHIARSVGKGGYSKGLPGLSQQLIIPAVKIDPQSKKLVLDKEVKKNRTLLQNQ